MKTVAETLHLQLRGTVWHYCRRVPMPLVPVLGRRFVKKSLGVSKLAEAKKLRTIEDLKSDALFAAAEAGKGLSCQDDGGQPVSLAMLTEHIRATVEQFDKKAADRLAADPPADAQELSEMRINALEELDILANPSDPRRDQWIDSFGRRILKEAGISSLDLPLMVPFAELVRRGLLELDRRKLDRYQDRYDRRFIDPLFDPARPAAVTFKELTDIFLAEKEESYRINGISRKRFDKVAAAVATLLEAVGDAVPVHAIDDDVVQKLRTTIARLPSNRGKIYPGMPLAKAVERAEKKGKAPINAVTQRFYLDSFRDILKIAVRKKLLPSNPAADIKPLIKNKVAADQARKPWTDEQLIGFFTGKFYRACAPDAAEPYSKADRPWRFWLPLIILFSGARPKEICQLHVEDIQQTKAGIWFMNITDESEGKSLKTQASRRRVPIHPELIRIGFLQFVEQRRQAKDGPRLFPGLKPDKYGNLAVYPAKRFNETFIPAEIKLEDRQSLYSLRHNVRDALRRIKAPPETLLAIAGWSPGGKAVSDDYGDPGNPDFHVEYVERTRSCGRI